MNNMVLLYSGGLDSYFAKNFLSKQKYEFDCIYFNHGGRYCLNEIKRIKNLSFPVIIKEDIKLKDIEKDDAYIPNRNILFTIMANSYGYEKVYIGGTKSDRIADNCKEIFDTLSTFLSMMNTKYFIATSPFWDIYKTDVIRWFLNQQNNDLNVVAKELLTNTFSCYSPLVSERKSYYYTDKKVYYMTEECMNCSACFRKNVELFSIDIFVPFYNLSIINKYKNEIKSLIQLNTRMEATLRYTNELIRRGCKQYE